MATPAAPSSNKSAAYDYLIKLLLIGDSGKLSVLFLCTLVAIFVLVYVFDRGIFSLHVNKLGHNPQHNNWCQLTLVLGVGKSCLLLRFSDDSFTPSFITTIGCVL